jgi:hypothetical protein
MIDNHGRSTPDHAAGFLAVANLSSIANGQGLIRWYSEEGSYRLFLDGKRILPGGISTSKFKNIQSSFGL